MGSWNAAPYYVRRILGVEVPALSDVAVERIEICPPELRTNNLALMLPGQLERVVAFPADTNLQAELFRLSDNENLHAGSYAYLLEDALLVEGKLFCQGYASHLLPETSYRFFGKAPLIEEPCALYASLYGSKYWGHWLKDDCSTYLIAKKFGTPVAPARPAFKHQLQYEALLGMQDNKLTLAKFKKLWVFSDYGQNASRRQRYAEIRQHLLDSVGVAAVSHPGVYISRADSGLRRLLINEKQIMEYFRSIGFRIIDTENYSVEAIIRACAGAQVVAGVEGSSLSHGAMLLDEGGSILVLNPPNRFNNIYKDVADCRNLKYATLVGELAGQDFNIPLQDVENIIALINNR